MENTITMECTVPFKAEDLELLVNLEDSLEDKMIITETVAALNGKDSKKLEVFISLVKESIPKVASTLAKLLPRYPIVIYVRDGNCKVLAILTQDTFKEIITNNPELIKAVSEWISKKG